MSASGYTNPAVALLEAIDKDLEGHKDCVAIIEGVNRMQLSERELTDEELPLSTVGMRREPATQTLANPSFEDRPDDSMPLVVAPVLSFSAPGLSSSAPVFSFFAPVLYCDLTEA